jgi:hypothetical protein
MNYFDEKQIKLITAWYDLSASTENSYMSFMSAWISFNAICYNLYYEDAVIERANIDRDKSKLIAIHERLDKSEIIEAKNTEIRSKRTKWNIDISLPERLFISVSNNYTESIIFEKYVDNYTTWYTRNISDTHEIFETLKRSLEKKHKEGIHHFVINMAKQKYLNDNENIEDLAGKNVIVLCESNNLKTIKNVLYQIRCNIFHGEKIPGDVNDDRIVKAALPMLQYIVKHLLFDCKIKTAGKN